MAVFLSSLSNNLISRNASVAVLCSAFLSDGSCGESKPFDIAQRTGGFHLNPSVFSGLTHIADVLDMASGRHGFGRIEGA
jgi:hypothetical protein